MQVVPPPKLVAEPTFLTVPAEEKTSVGPAEELEMQQVEHAERLRNLPMTGAGRGAVYWIPRVIADKMLRAESAESARKKEAYDPLNHW